MRVIRRVDLSQVTRQEAIFRNQFLLLEFTIDKCDISVLVEFSASYEELVGRFETITWRAVIVEEA